MAKIALILAFTALSACGTAPMSSPDDLAIYTRCDVDNIAHWVGQRVDYKEQGPVWDSAGVCMARVGRLQMRGRGGGGGGSPGHNGSCWNGASGGTGVVIIWY